MTITKTCEHCNRSFQGETEISAQRALRMHKTKVHGKMSKENKNQADETSAEKNEKTIKNLNLTPEMRAIAERASAQDTEWFTIREDELNDFDMQHSPYNITERNYSEAFKLQKEKRYAFRWCERKESRIDELTRSLNPPLRWAIVTRTTLPEMERHVDPVLGCVSCLDQILLFKPWSHHAMVKEHKNKMAEAKDNAGKAENVAMRNVDSDTIKPVVGEQAKIGGSDEVVYVDQESHEGETDLSDLVVDD